MIGLGKSCGSTSIRWDQPLGYERVRTHCVALKQDLEVEMVICSPARRTHGADRLPRPDDLTRLHRDRVQVSVAGLVASTVFDDNDVAIPDLWAHRLHGPRSRGQDRGAEGSNQVNSVVRPALIEERVDPRSIPRTDLSAGEGILNTQFLLLLSLGYDRQKENKGEGSGSYSAHDILLMGSHDRSHDRRATRRPVVSRKSLRENKWALQDLNLRPTDYESAALTN